MEIEVTEPGEHAATSSARHRVGRRAFLGAGAGGAALSLLPFLSGRAAASATTDESTTTAATTPPQRPTADDVALLSFVQQVEVTATALYGEAIAIGGWSDEQAVVVTFIRDAHRAYAQSLSGMLGRSAPNNMSQELFDGLRSDFVGDVAGVLAAAQAFESSAVATHGDVIAKLQGTDGAALLASIQIAEARFCTVLADLAGDTDPVTLLVDEEAESLVGRG
ncbi:MAG TPA: ferritin-like domain-containing protein [Ilumatobacteraceae bacterium]|nr:ferritin-like domain-containing protein [Ilumatobacteraceae bacterium]